MLQSFLLIAYSTSSQYHLKSYNINSKDEIIKNRGKILCRDLFLEGEIKEVLKVKILFSLF